MSGLIGSETASGIQRAWSLLEKLGEGDAGEVYRVESLLDRQIAILKRPRRGAFPSDLIRQADQIEKEGQALAALATLDNPGQTSGGCRTPTLVDRGRPGTEYTERYFIIISPAPGSSLATLARAALFGETAIQTKVTDPNTGQRLLVWIATQGRIPALIMLRALYGWIEFIAAAHTLRAEVAGEQISGILWNDIKPDHFFWDPLLTQFTLIDWGNARFLEQDGTTRDRRNSRIDDYAQFIAEMGRFLQDSNPALYRELEWPADVAPGNQYSGGILPLRERLQSLLEEEAGTLRQVRRAESDLLGSARLSYDLVPQLSVIQDQILSYGELPDYVGAAACLLRLARELVAAGDLERFHLLCNSPEVNAALPAVQCKLLRTLSEITVQAQIPPTALTAGLEENWPAALWELRQASMGQPEPPWWDEICGLLCNVEIGPDVLTPLTALNRLTHTLEASALKPSPSPTGSSNIKNEESSLQRSDPSGALLQRLRQEILPRWVQLEPDPPDSGLEYREIERHLEQLGVFAPEATLILSRALEQPRAQVKITLDAWERQDFEATRRALRRLLIWDPERKRVLQADRAIQTAPGWLAEVRNGMTRDEPLADWITRLEIRGRELRHLVGPASWLDSLLEGFRQLRKGMDPTDVLVEHPEIRFDLGWLITLEPRRPLLSSSEQPISIERKPNQAPVRPTVFGTKESELGLDSEFSLDEPLDTWSSEARGSSARLFQGIIRSPDQESAAKGRRIAVKVMRPDRAEYALPLFREEARILTLLRDVPGVIPMLECGFIQLDQEQLPPEDQDARANGLTGKILRFGLDSTHNFLGDLDARVARGWVPYIVIEQQERANNLLLHCDTGYTHGRFLPVLEGLCMAVQICDILDIAHTRNIIYRDHKILHYYWDGVYNGVFMIDWNIARRFPEGLTTADIQFDLVQFGARALHYILTGRPAPGALPLGPNRPDEIEAAAHSYTARWTYDDQRLPKDIKDLLEAVLAGSYNSARSLRDDLLVIFSKLAGLASSDQHGPAQLTDPTG